jgi:hypothetical protein
MKLQFSKSILAFAPFLTLIPLVTGAPAPVKLICGFMMIYYLPGITFLLLVGDRGAPRLDKLFLPLLLSPIIVSTMTIASFGLFGTLALSVRTTSAVLCVMLAGTVLARRPSQPLEASPVPRGVICICAAFGALVLLTYLANGFLIVRSDSWYHASVVSEILDRGIPPKEPWLPDTPIRYMWIYHLFIASSKELMGISVFHALGLFNIVNAFVFPYLIARFTWCFTRKASHIMIAPVFAIAGLESPAWILWVVSFGRAAFGHVRGIHELSRVLEGINLDSERVIYFLSPFEHWQRFGNYMVNTIDKFLTVTPFNHALNLFLLCFIIVISIEFRRRAPVRSSLCLFVLVLAALLFHIIVGGVLVLTVVGSGILVALLQRIRHRQGMPPTQALVLSGVAILAGACVLPYLWPLMPQDTGGTGLHGHFHLGLRNCLTIALPLAILFIPVRKAIKDIFSFASDERTVLGMWLVSLLLINICINLPTRNESKLIFPLFILLCPPVAWAIVDALRAARGRQLFFLSLGTALLFAVPPVLTVRGFMLDRASNHIDEKRGDITTEDRRIFTWLEENSKPNAVVIESNEYCMMPIFAHRRNLYPPQRTITVSQYVGSDVEHCKRIRDTLYSGEPFTQADVDFMAGLGVEVFVVLWREDLERRPGLETQFRSCPEQFEKRYENSRALIYWLQRT